ncbi:phage tail protein [Candidatus Magnetaquicoccus inordinatus]|uniref:phage tail protein n=1 Tax=Candidatus Magnetaquicoccus inordinatus TaxID=2496818 RepID=UPI00102C928A|nr:phage tail protein [Candidatus Magnetaquicoccus inordinatus]
MSSKSGNVVNNAEPRANGIAFQGSIYGTAIPIAYGRARMPGNMIWYGDFRSIAHTTSQDVGGKGGGGNTVVSTTYTYTASFCFGLCEGPIVGIDGIWSNKEYKADPANLSEVVTPSAAWNEPHIISGSHQVTVAHGAQWTSHISCVAIDGEVMTPLTLGTDFVVNGGTYYFATEFSNIQVQISYNYNAINSSSSVVTVFNGAFDQCQWTYLVTNHPEQALNYPGIAYAASMDWQLGSGTALPNLNFDVIGQLSFDAANGIYDAHPKDVIIDLLTNTRYGLGFPVANLGDWTQYHRYCTASGLFLSPVYAAQEETSAIIARLMKITNSEVYFSEGVLKVTPLGDALVTGNGVTFTPNLTPVYELTEDDFIVSGLEDPVTVTRKPSVDVYNHVKVEFLNASNQFNTEVAEAKDMVSIDLFGLRSMDSIKFHEIKSAAVARMVAQNILQRTQYVRNSYGFKLGWRHCLLEPTDLVTLTDAGTGLDKTPVRILSIEEDEIGLLTVEAEDAPFGVFSTATYLHQTVGGYVADFNKPSGAINTPVVFDAPIELTPGLREIWVAISGGENYGGCQVWLSSDGSNYKKIGEIVSPSRHGFLTETMASGSDPDITHTCKIDLSESGGTLTSGTIADADNRATLAWVDGEFIAYSTATLTGSHQYTLDSYLRRGLYGSTIKTHPSQSRFVRCDGTIFRYAYDPALVGKTIYMKFPAFNQFGGGGQSLADAAEYSFRVGESAA